MKLWDRIRPSHSISARLTLRVTFTIFLVFTTITAIIAGLMWLVGSTLMGAIYYNELELMNQKTANAFTTVEVAIANNVPEVESSLKDPDRMYQIVERILKLNPNIVGTTIAFSPGFFQTKGFMYAPFAYRQDTIIKAKQLGNSHYNYFQKEWFKRPFNLRKACWSDPYYDDGGANLAIATYSHPLFDRDGNIYAILTADISLDWITKMATEAEYTDDTFNFSSDSTVSYISVIGHAGTYIVHPDSQRIMKQSMKDVVKKTTTKLDDRLYEKMVNGERGMTTSEENGQKVLAFYAPISHTGWSMAIMVPFSELFEGGNIMGMVILIPMVLGLIVVFIVSYLTIRRVIRPLKRFTASAHEIAKGHFAGALPVVKTRDEMMQLRESFETMQQSLVKQMEELKIANETKGRIEGELQTARNIQMSMLPKTFPAFPNRDDIDVFGQLNPAKEVGGDLYDFFIRDEKLFFCVGDVSGKGVPASLLMAVTRSLFRTMAAHNSSPANIVSHMNDAMSETNDTLMFVTLFVGALDLPTGRLRYCNAGHCAPVLVGDEGVRLLPITPNIPSGITSNYSFEVQETTIASGTTIFLYTDGLTEAENMEKQLFAEDRMKEVCRNVWQDNADMSPRQLIQAMTEAIHIFVGEAEQSDDLTMLAIKYTQVQEVIQLQRSLTLPNDIETIPQLNEFVDSICEKAGVDMAVTMSMNLALEEAVVNVMNYAYPEGSKGDVTIQATVDKTLIKFTIMDEGMPFDPTAKEDVDTTLSAEERPIGGLGIHLVRQIMDSVNYEYTDGRNVLTLRKMLNLQNMQQQ